MAEWKDLLCPNFGSGYDITLVVAVVVTGSISRLVDESVSSELDSSCDVVWKSVGCFLYELGLVFILNLFSGSDENKRILFYFLTALIIYLLIPERLHSHQPIKNKHINMNFAIHIQTSAKFRDQEKGHIACPCIYLKLDDLITHHDRSNLSTIFSLNDHAFRYLTISVF
ncbi:hypothetical protein WICPIJ_002409 [Wickerhamomyces pijperi]|uniref:Uncharacterized protein n=1 Tax=Wickerhamomyces pijperi TaxID=599730 RepID=A0A9P8QBI6_WICPI|nr:hypothetical protein WICPIJ_002409 [Wickerhamomyces pijperi]